MSSPDFRVSSIPDIVQCVTANITWAGGTPPYAIQINPPEGSGGNVSPMARATSTMALVARLSVPATRQGLGIVPNVHDAYFLWTPVFPGGTHGDITVFDDNMRNISASYVVSSNSFPSCDGLAQSRESGPEGPTSVPPQNTMQSSTAGVVPNFSIHFSSPSCSLQPSCIHSSTPTSRSPQLTSSEFAGLHSSSTVSAPQSALVATEIATTVPRHQTPHSALSGETTAAIALATIIPLITLGVFTVRFLLRHRRRTNSDIVSPWLSPPRPDRDSHAYLSTKTGLLMTQSAPYHSSDVSSVETHDSIPILGRFSNEPSIDSLHCTLPADEHSLPSRHTGVQDTGRSGVVQPRPPSMITQPQICYEVGEARRMHTLYWQMAQARTRRVEVDGGVSLAGGALRGVDQMSESIGSTLPPPYPQQ